jgi:hypothetical protein
MRSFQVSKNLATFFFIFFPYQEAIQWIHNTNFSKKTFRMINLQELLILIYEYFWKKSKELFIKYQKHNNIWFEKFFCAMTNNLAHTNNKWNILIDYKFNPFLARKGQIPPTRPSSIFHNWHFDVLWKSRFHPSRWQWKTCTEASPILSINIFPSPDKVQIKFHFMLDFIYWKELFFSKEFLLRRDIKFEKEK